MDKKQRKYYEREISRSPELRDLPTVEQMEVNPTVRSLARRDFPQSRAESNRWIALALALFGTIAPEVASAEELDAKTGFEAAAEISPEANLQRIQAAFLGVDRQRTDAGLLEEIPVADLADYIQTVQEFSTEEAIAFLADYSQVPAEQLLAENDLQTVLLYTPEWLDHHANEIAGLNDAAVVDRSLLLHWKEAGGFTAGNIVGLNLKVLQQIDPEHRAQATKEVLGHELIHSWQLESIQGDDITAWDMRVHEGTVEAMNVAMGRALYPEAELYDGGYLFGEKATGIVLMAALGEDVVAQSILTDNYGLLETSFNERYGDGAWNLTVPITLQINQDGPNGSLVPLFSLLAGMRSDAEPIVNQANARLGGATIFDGYTDGQISQLYIRDDRFDIFHGFEIVNVPEIDIPMLLQLSPYIDIEMVQLVDVPEPLMVVQARAPKTIMRSPLVGKIVMSNDLVFKGVEGVRKSVISQLNSVN